MTLEEAKFFFQQDKFATCAAGIVLKELDENGAVCTMTITDNHLNAVGSVMGRLSLPWQISVLPLPPILKEWEPLP